MRAFRNQLHLLQSVSRPVNICLSQTPVRSVGKLQAVNLRELILRMSFEATEGSRMSYTINPRSRVSEATGLGAPLCSRFAARLANEMVQAYGGWGHVPRDLAAVGCVRLME